MSVMDMNSRMAMAEKLSIPQLQQAIQSGSLPAYIGIPLIEQKTKERAQMAAAQGGQQRPPSVASQILQQAEQEEQGIDQLPSNLPVMDDEEMGMAGGGIIAFADEGQVRDPDRDPRITALRQDPAYLAFAESGGINGDTSLTAFLQAGNAPRTTASGPDYEPAPATSPAGDFARSVFDDVRSRFRAMPNQEQRNEMRDLGVRSGIFGVGSDASRAQAEKELRERLYGTQSTPVTTLPTTVVTAGRDPAFSMEDTAGTTYTPPPKGASGTPTETPSGERNAPSSAETPSGGRNALPPTLAAAERSNSPAAEKATSMLDKYVAQLEKSGEDVSRQKKEAFYMAMIQGGLGVMGGTSPNAFANISKGLLPATQSYQQALAGIKKDERARLEKLISAGLKKEEFALKAEELGIKRETARLVYDAAMARNRAIGGSGSDEIKRANAIRSLDAQLSTNLSRVDSQIKNLNSANPMMAAYLNKSPDQIPKGIRDQVAAYRSQLGKLEGEKNKWVNLHSSRVQSLGGVTLGEIEGSSGSGNMPKGIPQGSRQVGTSGGKPVYEAPDGKRYIVE